MVCGVWCGIWCSSVVVYGVVVYGVVVYGMWCMVWYMV